MTEPRPPVFLERATYRRRRMMDAARILPVVGFLLILLPVLWTRHDGAGIAGEAIYLFALWAGLVLGAAALAAPLRRAQAQGDRPADSPAPPADQMPPSPPSSRAAAPPAPERPESGG